MKRLSNVFFYLGSCLAISVALYLFLEGEKKSWQDIFMLAPTLLIFTGYGMNLVDRYAAISAIRDHSNRFSFSLIIPLGKRYRNWRILSFSTSILFGLGAGVFLLLTTPETFLCGLLLLLSGIEKLFYIIYSGIKNYFRLGISSNSVIICNGGLQVIPMAGLRSIETKYDELLFIYSDNSVKSIFYPVSENDLQKTFEQKIREMGKEKGISIKI